MSVNSGLIRSILLLISHFNKVSDRSDCPLHNVTAAVITLSNSGTNCKYIQNFDGETPSQVTFWKIENGV